jgi:hypothetical protein
MEKLILARFFYYMGEARIKEKEKRESTIMGWEK